MATRRKSASSKGAEEIEPSEASARVLAKLRSDHGIRIETLADIGIDHVLSRRIDTFIDADELTDVVVRSVTGANAQRLLQRHLLVGRRRYEGWLLPRRETPGDWMGRDATRRLEEIIAEMKPPRGKWLEGAVDPSDVRALLSPVIQETLTRFVQKLPIPGMASGSGSGSGSSGGGGLGSKFLSGFGKGAERLVDASRSVLGGLGAEMEQRFASVARDFSQSATGEMRAAFADRARSDEGRRLLARMRKQAVAHVLGTPVATIVADGQKLPWDELLGLAEPIAAHLHEYAPFREAVRHEVVALLGIEGSATLGERLSEAGILEPVRASIRRRVSSEVSAVLATPAFVAWLNELLAD